MPHPKDFEHDGDSLDKLNSRFFHTALFASIEEELINPPRTQWLIKVGGMRVYYAFQYKEDGHFSMIPISSQDNNHLEDILRWISITSIDDVLDYLQRKMSCA
jgi:hypothetical protein